MFEGKPFDGYWLVVAYTMLAEDQVTGQSVKFTELVQLLEQNGFILVKEKGSIRYYGKAGCPRLIRVDYHGAKEVPTGTCHAILKAAGIARL